MKISHFVNLAVSVPNFLRVFNHHYTIIFLLYNAIGKLRQVESIVTMRTSSLIPCQKTKATDRSPWYRINAKLVERCDQYYEPAPHHRKRNHRLQITDFGSRNEQKRLRVGLLGCRLDALPSTNFNPSCLDIGAVPLLPTEPYNQQSICG